MSKSQGFISLATAFLVILSQPAIPDGSNTPKPIHIGMTSVSGHVVTYTDTKTSFEGYAICPDDNIARYGWDFDDDGVIDFSSARTGFTTHTFTKAGRYVVTFRAYTQDGRELPISEVRVIVRKGSGKPVYIPRRYLNISASEEDENERLGFIESLELETNEREFLQISPVVRSEDAETEEQDSAAVVGGQPRLYVLIINGGSESRYWDDVNYAYEVFTVDYGIAPKDIYFLNYGGTNPAGENPDDMIDYSATKGNLQLVCAELTSTVDEDDMLYVFITDHGRGYTGPIQYTTKQQAIYGYLDGDALVDEDDEQDYIESEFKLRSFMTGGNYICNHGMNEWKVYYSVTSTTTYYYRHMYVSHFADANFIDEGLVSDDDIYIEEFKDYLAGDLDKDGQIKDGEVIDFDGDGKMPYEHSTGTFDEDDWGQIDTFRDDVRNINTQVPKGFLNTYWILDYGLDGYLDIDLDHDPENPEVNGTDLDNAGRFDGLDVNDDKDMDDWVSIDEKICLYYPGGDMTDDEFASFLEPINAKVIVVSMLPCFGGGFIEDLRGGNRIIMTSCEEETVSWGDRFVRNIVSALGQKVYPDSAGDPSTADTNGDGLIDMVEVFNFVAGNDYAGPIQMPQYCDNADGVSVAYPVALAPVCYGEEGWLGNRVTLEGWEVWLSDFDADRKVDTDDLAEMCASWLYGGNYFTDIAPEPEGDGIVDTLDIATLAGEWLSGI
jgi:hypothetical protein